MTDDERQTAIEAKRAQLAAVDTALIFGKGLKLTVLQPKPDETISEELSRAIGAKMLDMVTANGIGGIGGDPALIFAGGVTSKDKKLTGTVPQKTMVTFNVQYYVANLHTGTVFGSLTHAVTGVGNDEAQAMKNAVSEIKNDSKMQQMLATAQEKIITYYNENAATIMAEVKALAAQNDFEGAYTLMRGVPEQSKELFAFCEKEIPAMSGQILIREATNNLNQMKAAMAANDTAYAEEVGAYLALIPSNCPQYKEAHAAFDKYLASIETKAEKRAAMKAKQEEADFQRKMQMMAVDAKLAHEASVDGRWDTAFGLIDSGIDCVRDIGVTWAKNSSWTSFLNRSNWLDD